MIGLSADWRVIGDGTHAWFDAPSHAAGAALADAVSRKAGGDSTCAFDIRPTGVRVRISDTGEASAQLAEAVSAAAAELGLTADSTALQVVGLTIDTPEPATLVPFWRTVLAYRGETRLADPLRRDPSIRFHRDDEVRPLRNRSHVDVVRPSAGVAATLAELDMKPFGPYGVCISDPEGNLVDLVPGGPLSDAPGVEDWLAPFSAIASYPGATSLLTTAAAGLADDAGMPLLIDVRPDGVTIDSGKDLWGDDDGPHPAFVELAAGIQSVAREGGLVADLAHPRFVQVCIDAVDYPRIRDFWSSLLGYEKDDREGVSDIYDPRRLNPVLFFQIMDGDDPRRDQRDRMRLTLHLPVDQLQNKIDTATAAGGSATEMGDDHVRLTDPEGNELDVYVRPHFRQIHHGS